MGGVVRARAREQPDRVAVRLLGSAGEAVTYGALDARSDRAAAAFAGLGLRRGDNAAVMLDNSPAFLDAWIGLAKLGVVEVPVNTAYRGNLLAHVLAQTACRVAVVGAAYVERLAEVAPRLPALTHVLVAGPADGSPPEVPGKATAWFSQVLAGAPAAPPPLEVGDAEPSVVLYTSGTTGPSKGVVLSHRANVRLARTISAASGFAPGEVLFTAFPLFHVAARYVSVLAAMLVDGEVVLAERFSASRFWDDCRAHRVTAIHYLGSLLTLLLKQPERPGDRAHAVRLGYGAGAPEPVWEAIESRFGIRLYELYGMTETGVVTMNREGAYRRGTCGTVLDDCEVAVVDDRDEPLPPGAQGEIVVRPREPATMITEYLALPEATLAAFRNLWFHTGDLGVLDGEGYLRFTGRSKDAIRRRGENVSAFEVETAVEEHDAVEACAVVGVDDAISGEEILAVVTVKPGHALSAPALLDHLQPRLPHFAVPRYVRFVAALPRTPSQRVEKYKLRAEGLAKGTWDREAEGYEVRR